MNNWDYCSINYSIELRGDNVKYKKLVISIILVMIASYLLISFKPITSSKVLAVRGAPGNLTRDIDGLDDGLYPGYKVILIIHFYFITQD